MEEEEEEEEDEELAEDEEDLVRMMKDSKRMDAVWANMVRSMREQEGVEVMEDGDDEDEEGDGHMDRPEDDEEGDDLEEEGEEGQGNIHIRNSQRSIPIDTTRLQRQLRAILEIVGRADHDVSLWLTNDRSIREYNDRYRGKRHATDILSFPFHEYDRPEHPSKESVRLNGQIKDLGDMMISMPYVQRQCQRDEEDWKELGENPWSEERGASGAMSRVFDVEGRLPYLIIHGVLHLLG